MTKAEIVLSIKEKLDNDINFKKKKINLNTISQIIEILFFILKENISKGEHIELRGFGTFDTKIREPKKAINPRTKESVNVERHAIPIFRPGKELKSSVRKYFDKKLNK